jgi:hypothetical protein
LTTQAARKISHKGKPAAISGSAVSCAEPANTSTDISAAIFCVSPELTIAMPVTKPQMLEPISPGVIVREAAAKQRRAFLSGHQAGRRDEDFKEVPIKDWREYSDFLPHTVCGMDVWQKAKFGQFLAILQLKSFP